ncbi:MAG: tRNA 2-thiouridine(34) synthase MnmA [Acidobacteriota bacterium]
MRTAVLLSGGVDSSVALSLLHRSGEHRLTAFYLKIWLEDELSFAGHCPWEDDLKDARAVCDGLGIPLEVVPLQREYHEAVVRWAVSELRAGRTPSPDILCNRKVKFGAFLDYLEDAHPGQFGRIVSGHYARCAPGKDGRHRLLRGVDPVKDQTYFLFRLTQDQLGRCLFPLGGLHKREVRALARGMGLPNRDRPDSQGICFLGSLPYDAFVRGQLGEWPGEIRRIDTGSTLGDHRGHWFHTIGQRKGLGLGGGPWFVVDKDPERNLIWVAHGDDLDDHRRRTFRVTDVHWIEGSPPAEGHLGLRIRHGPKILAGEVSALGDGTLSIRLPEPDPGVAPGQVAVLYDGDVCLGGGGIVTPTAHFDEP